MYEAHKGNYGHYHLFYLKTGRIMLTYRGALCNHRRVKILVLAAEFEAEGEAFFSEKP
jgi:hypothetical protein